MKEKIRVLIVDDDYYVRQALNTLLGKDRRTKVVGEAASPEETIALVAEAKSGLQPDVILLDVEYKQSPMTGIDAVREIRQQMLEVKILVFSMTRDDDFILEASQAGADGYLWKNEAAEGIASAIERVYEGRFVVTKSVAQLILGKVSNLGHEAAEIFPGSKKYLDLTRRVGETIRLFCIDGLSAAEIAEALNITENTVRGHIKTAYEILGVSSRSEAFQRLVAREDEW
jgi:two-component system nitrate/nitrite response regulator NarL